MRSTVISMLTMLIVVAVMIYQGQSIEPVLAEPSFGHLEELVGFRSESVEIDEVERKILPADTKIERRLYRGVNGESIIVSLVIGGRTKSSIHRPELCLPSQGFQMMNPKTIRVDDIGWRSLELVRRDSEKCRFAYTFFNQAGYRTSSHIKRIFCDVLDRSFRHRIDRWVMITVSAFGVDERGQVEFLKKLRKVIK